MSTEQVQQQQQQQDYADEEQFAAEDEIHRLERQWTLWFDDPQPGRRVTENNFLKSLRQVYTFDTVEEFWSLMNHIVQPVDLKKGTTYRLMKEDLNPPAWEHPMCAGGGEWILSIKNDSQYMNLLNDMWKNLCMSCIGEWFEQMADVLCGCNVAARKSEVRVSVWITTCDLVIAKAVGEHMKAFLEIAPYPELKLYFKSFKDMVEGKQDPLLTL